MVDIYSTKILIIDTDKYSGNFDRQLCAYITGQVGGCGVGEEEAEIAKKELDQGIIEFFDQQSVERCDEDGEYHVCSIWETPGFFSDGTGNYWPISAPEEEVRKSYLESRKQTIDRYIAINENFLKEDPSKEYLKKVIAGHKRQLEDLKSKPINKFPAYQSVAIFLRKTTEIPENIKVVIDKRAKEYGEKHNIKILGFRLLKVELEDVVY